jgi:hypothetical protein
MICCNPDNLYHDTYFRLRKILLMLFICASCSGIHAQMIKGSISDKSTGKAIPYATIYFSGTTIGTASDEQGYFELKLPKDLTKPLTISSVGYYSLTMNSYLMDEPIFVQLQPKTYELKEVVISAKESENIRKANFPIFRSEFLGNNWNAQRCKIMNEEDILLSYDDENQILKAFSDHPVQIHNEVLGYKMIYFLDHFEFCTANDSLILTGNYIFSQDTAADSRQQIEFDRRRGMAYLGSRMHFFRSLWDNQLNESGFTVRDSRGAKLSYNEIVVEDSIDAEMPQKYLHYREALYVYYKKTSSKTRMTLQNEYVFFDRSGFFDPLGIVWQGDLGQQRISVLLPFEYILPDEISH